MRRSCHGETVLLDATRRLEVATAKLRMAKQQLEDEAVAFQQKAEEWRELAQAERALATKREEDALAVVRELGDQMGGVMVIGDQLAEPFVTVGLRAGHRIISHPLAETAPNFIVAS